MSWDQVTAPKELCFSIYYGYTVVHSRAQKWVWIKKRSAVDHVFPLHGTDWKGRGLNSFCAGVARTKVNITSDSLRDYGSGFVFRFCSERVNPSFSAHLATDQTRKKLDFLAWQTTSLWVRLLWMENRGEINKKIYNYLSPNRLGRALIANIRKRHCIE